MKKIFSIICGFAFLASGCNFLDIVPEGDIQTIETVFEQRSKVDGWVETCYRNVSSQAGITYNVAYTGADELVGNDKHRYNNDPLAGNIEGLKIADGLQSAMDVISESWTNKSYYATIRYCNTFFEHIDKTHNMEAEEREMWTAEVKAAKAWMYFQLIRKYGPIILLDHTIGVDTEIEDMKLPRSHVDTCFNEVVRLLDEAIPALPRFVEKRPDRQGYFCKESAMALKAIALVYQASPLFNGNPSYASFTERDGTPLFSATADKEKWHRAALACDEAIEACDGYFELVEGTNDQGSELLNTIRDLQKSVQIGGTMSSTTNKELLYVAKVTNSEMMKGLQYFAYTLPAFKQNSYLLNNPPSDGSLSPSMKMVEMYYTENGLPIDEDPAWNGGADKYGFGATFDAQKYQNVIPEGERILNLHLNREPRFYANIAFDRGYWMGKIRSSDNGYQVIEARKGERWGTDYSSLQLDQQQNRTGYWLTKFIYMDLTVDGYTSQAISQGDAAMPLIRMAQLYLMSSEAWNEYLDNPLDAKVLDGINKVRTRAGIPKVEDAWRNSYHPDKINTKAGMREIIQQETCIELAFEGQRFWDLRRWLLADRELNSMPMGWNVVAESEDGFYNYGDGPIPVWHLASFVAPRDYLWPINTLEIQKSGIVQNPGW